MYSKKNTIVACVLNDRKISFINLIDGVCTMETLANVNFASEEANQIYEEFPTLFAYMMKEKPATYAADFEKTLKWYDFGGKKELRKFKKSMENPEVRDVFPLCEAEEVCVETGENIVFIKNKLYTPFCTLWNAKDSSFKLSIQSKPEKIRLTLVQLCSDIGVNNLSDLKNVKAELPTNDVVFHGMEW